MSGACAHHLRQSFRVLHVEQVDSRDDKRQRLFGGQEDQGIEGALLHLLSRDGSTMLRHPRTSHSCRSHAMAPRRCALSGVWPDFGSALTAYDRVVAVMAPMWGMWAFRRTGRSSGAQRSNFMTLIAAGAAGCRDLLSTWVPGPDTLASPL